MGKSRSGRQSPYQDDFNEPPREKKSTSGMSRRMSGVGHPHQHHGSGQIARVEGLLPGFGPADGVDHHVDAEAVGEVLDGLDDVEFAGVDGVGGAELAGPVQFRVVGVDRDDPLGADQRGPRDRGIAHAAAADHRDGVVAVDRAGVDRGTQPGHHPAAQQPGDRRIGLGVDLGALARGHQRLVGERPDAQRRRELGAVGQRHLLFGVERVEAEVRACRACRPGTGRTPHASSGSTKSPGATDVTPARPLRPCPRPRGRAGTDTRR